MPLRQYMEKGDGIPLETFLPLAKALVASIGELHQQHMIHLELRPERITIFTDKNSAAVNDCGFAVQRNDDRYIRPNGHLVSEPCLPYCSPKTPGACCGPSMSEAIFIP